MKIQDYKVLEKKINNQNFNEGYKTVNFVLLVLSWFGHLASIFLAYFMLSKIISTAMTDNQVAVFISSIINLNIFFKLNKFISLFNKISKILLLEFL